MQIRTAESFDESAVLELYRVTPELPGNSVLDFLDGGDRAHAFLRQDQVFLVAENGDSKLVGFVYVKVRAESAPEEQARLLHLVVVPDKRSKGVARELLRECKRRLDGRGIHRLYFNVNATNVSMTKFALRNGFKPTRISVRFDLDFTNDNKPQPPPDDPYDLRHDD